MPLGNCPRAKLQDAVTARCREGQSCGFCQIEMRLLCSAEGWGLWTEHRISNSEASLVEPSGIADEEGMTVPGELLLSLKQAEVHRLISKAYSVSGYIVSRFLRDCCKFPLAAEYAAN